MFISLFRNYTSRIICELNILLYYTCRYIIMVSLWLVVADYFLSHGTSINARTVVLCWALWWMCDTQITWSPLCAAAATKESVTSSMSYFTTWNCDNVRVRHRRLLIVTGSNEMSVLVCACVRAHVCVCVHVCACPCVCVHARIRAYARLSVRTCVCACVTALTRVCVSVFVRVYAIILCRCAFLFLWSLHPTVFVRWPRRTSPARL